MKEEEQTNRLLSVGRASMRSGLTKNMIRLLCDNGTLRHFRQRTHRKISMRSLDEYVEKLFDGEVQLPEFPYTVRKREEQRRLREAKKTGDLKGLRDLEQDDPIVEEE